ncbi:calcium-binding protein [Thalassobius sp. I31.1]|uniref:calcium-binding protein n=1 Tax=Thalassobius sp. I31.1 TaxID=2109912 RepID=UPI000D1AB3AC|nr:calcium-binding protein [Thalassobius sp. I31.1]
MIYGGLADVLDGGSGADTLQVQGEIYAGEVDGVLALATVSSGGFDDDAGLPVTTTNLAFNVEILSGSGSIDFSYYTGGITWDAEDSVVHYDNSSLLLNGDFTVTGSSGDDHMTGAGDGVLTGGLGDDTLIGGDGDVLLGDSGDDYLISGGNGGVHGGAGNDIIEAKTGDSISGDANDTLTLDGVPITGDIIEGNGSLIPYGDDLLADLKSRDVVIFVTPSLLQFHYDGTQASIIWDGYIVLNPDDSNFTPEGRFIRSTADATIGFQFGDFGIQPSGITGDPRAYGLVNDVRIADLPIGEITGSDPGSFDQNPDNFLSDLHISYEDLSDYHDAAESLGEDGFGDVIGGSSNDDTLSGSDGNERLRGGNGNDHLTGGGGNDAFIFATGDGHDTISDFDPEQDQIFVDGGIISDLGNLPEGMTVTATSEQLILHYGSGDTITILSSPALISAYPELFGFTDTNVISGTETADVINGSFVDANGHVLNNTGQLLHGFSGDDLISAGDGSDLIFGGDGDDTIYGRKGWDTIYGGNGNDTISGNKGLNTLYGDAGNDTIYSGEHSSKLYGGTGDDTLVAHFKKNVHHTLTGGEGADSFVFNLGSTSKYSRATVTDFELGQDTLIIGGNEVDLQAPGAGIDVSQTDDGILVEFNDNEWVLLEGIFDLI